MCALVRARDFEMERLSKACENAINTENSVSNDNGIIWCKQNIF